MIAAARRAQAGLFAAGALLLAGCAAPLATQVTAFHQLPAAPAALAGQRFIVGAATPQADGLEFATYADAVRRALVGHGLVDAGSGPVDLEVTLRYAQTALPVALPSASGVGIGVGSGIGIGIGGGGGVSFGFGFGVPIGGGAAAQRERVRYEAWMTIDRRQAAAGANRRAYEGHAVAEGPVEGGMPRVMPALIRALFVDFPGASGLSRQVEVPLDEAVR